VDSDDERTRSEIFGQHNHERLYRVAGTIPTTLRSDADLNSPLGATMQ